jgi:xylulokinase
LTRSVLEGVAFGLRDSLELMRSVGVGEVGEIRATGGGIKSRLWRQILADVLETSLVTTTTSEGAAHGAAILAAVGAGWFATVEDACRHVVALGDRIAPSPPDDVYRERYAQYRSLYPALTQTFHSLG